MISSNAKLDIKLLYARCRYTGTVWEVSTSNDSSQIVSGNLVWSTNKLTIALTGYTAAPIVQATQCLVATPYHIQAIATSSTNIDVQFYDLAATLITTQGTSMDFNLLLLGV